MEQQVGDDQQEKPLHYQVPLVLYEGGWVPAAAGGHQGPAFNGGAVESRQVWRRMPHRLHKTQGQGSRSCEDGTGQHPTHGPLQAARQAARHASCHGHARNAHRRR